MREDDFLTATLIWKMRRNGMDERKIGKSTVKHCLSQYTIVKRNGMLVPFRRERIFTALEAAFRDTKKVMKASPLPEGMRQTMDSITDLVVEEASHLASLGHCSLLRASKIFWS